MSESPSRTRLILVRHGALEPLRVAGVVCSPLRRAVETATCIAAPHGLTVAPLPAFRELSFGEWEGLTSSEATARDPELHPGWQKSPATMRPPGGETLQEAAERTIPALKALIARHAGEKVVLVTHNLIIRVLLCHALGAGLSTVGHIQCQPGSITIVDVRGGQYVVRLLNGTCHLQKGDLSLVVQI